MKTTLCMAVVTFAFISAATGEKPAAKAATDDPRVQAVIDEVEKECLKGPRYIYTIGAVKAKRRAELVRQAKPQLVVECGTAIGYSGLWIARQLKVAGRGKVVTIEVNPKIARRAEGNFRRAGLADIVTVKVGDARNLVKEVKGPVDFVFIDCGAPNYLPCLKGLEKNLAPGATIVADNVGVSQHPLGEYFKLVRSRYQTRTEWFDVNLPWAKRDAMEISVVPK